jgi:hypothetical protein
VKEIIMSLGHYPMVGGFLSILQIVIAHVIKADPTVVVMVPPVLMQIMQIGAWLGAIGVAIVTILGWLKNNTNVLDNWKWMKEKK